MSRHNGMNSIKENIPHIVWSSASTLHCMTSTESASHIGTNNFWTWNFSWSKRL